MGKTMPYIRTGQQPPKNDWFAYVVAIVWLLAMLATSMALGAWATKKVQKQKEMDSAIYQKKAMRTKMSTCDNLIYMLGLLHEEAGELQGKLNKAQRKGLIKYHNNQAIFVGTYEQEQEFIEECKKELGDICWSVAGIAEEFDWELGDVMQGNIDKLADRLNRGVIEGKGDNR